MSDVIGEFFDCGDFKKPDFDPRSISYDQTEILEWIRRLHCNDKFDVDASYGNGSFYKKMSKPFRRFDTDENMKDCEFGDSRNLPLQNESVESVVFDPPFLTYVQNNREHNTNMVMSSRFSGYVNYVDLTEHYQKSLDEFNRVLKKKGVVVFKCQDIIHNHKMHATHINVVNWAGERGFRLKDLFILNAKNRIPRSNKGRGPQHARVFHSYFLVLEKMKTM